MKSLPRPPTRRQRDTTIGLVNIVFLMLIFFLVAGTVSRPLDKDVRPALSNTLEPSPPPDALAIRADGSIWHGGQAATIASFMAYSMETYGQAEQVKVFADQNLPAAKLVAIAQELKAAGALNVLLITERNK